MNGPGVHEPSSREGVLSQQLLLTNELFNKFLEWRHRIMTRFFVAVGALVVAIRWLYEYEHVVTAWPAVLACLAGSAFSVIAFALDRVNQDLLDLAYDNGNAVEASLGTPPSCGLFSRLHERRRGGGRPRWRTYRVILAAVYLVAGALFLLAAVLVGALA